jgi:hypothetical protein
MGRALLSGILVLLAGPLAHARDDRSVPELLREVLTKKDDVAPDVLDELGRRREKAALEALERAVGGLKEPAILERAFGAFRYYADAGALSDEAIAFLAEHVGAQQRERRWRGSDPALDTLIGFGESAVDELETIAREHRSGRTRAKALHAILPRLAARGDEGAIDLVLGAFEAPEAGTHEELLATLRGFQKGASAGHLALALGNEKLSLANRMAILETLDAASEPQAEAELEAALKCEKEPPLLSAAIDGLRVRGGTGHVRELERLADHEDDAVRRAAWIALAHVRGGDEAFVKKLFALAKARDPVERQSAAVAFAELRTREALDALYALLGDPEYAVRAEALAAVTSLRRKDSIEPLIARLAVETGKMRIDVARSLQTLTGLELGALAERWKTWWRAEGAAFELPPLAEVNAREAALAERHADDSTRASFYGMQVVSDRVCFVLDVSLSMEERVGTGKETRLDVAKRELTSALERFPEGELANVIFFCGSVFPWRDGLAVLNTRARQDAIGFVQKQTAQPSTAIFDALEAAFEDPRVDTIYLLSDGDPNAGRITDPAEIQAEIRRMNTVRKITIHTISIGGPADLLEALAEDSGGQYREVR